MRLVTIPLILTGLAVFLTTLQVFLVWRLSRGRRPFGSGLHEQALAESSPGFPQDDSTPVPRVSILKPLCGLDDELLDNLRSFASLHGVSYELILSVADPHDPAVEVANAFLRDYPTAPCRLVIGGGSGATNPKVARLLAAAPFARGEIILISDANVRTSTWDLARTLQCFDDQRVGCVSNLFIGSGTENVGATLEALHLLSFVVPGCVLASAFQVPCVVGKSMAIRGAVLQEIGGFAAFGNVLAEDQAIGLAVDRAGYRVVGSPVVVRNVIVRRTVGRALARQIRWNKIRFAFSKAIYASELLLCPLPWAVLFAAATRVSLLACAVVALTLLARFAQVTFLRFSTNAPLTNAQLLAVPFQDLLQFAAHFVPYVSNTVTWQTHRARLGRGTLMLPVEEIAAAGQVLLSPLHTKSDANDLFADSSLVRRKRIVPIPHPQDSVRK